MAQQTPARQRSGASQPFAETSPGVRPASDGGRRMWRRAEIEKFYSNRRRGLYDGPREVEGIRIERDILAAARENRIADPVWQDPHVK